MPHMLQGDGLGDIQREGGGTHESPRKEQEVATPVSSAVSAAVSAQSAAVVRGRLTAGAR